MDQNLLDSARFSIHSLSIDSRFADQYNCGTEDFTIRLPSTQKNIARIAISSVELPEVEYLFSERHGNLNFEVDVSGTWVSGTIPAGTFKDTELVSVVNAAFQAIDPNFEVVYDKTTGIVSIYNVNPFYARLVSDNPTIAARSTHWGLGYQLGFRDKGLLTSVGPDASGAYQISGTSFILVQPTPYYLLQLYTPDLLENITHRVSAGGSVPAFAKLILRDSFYFIQFNDNSDYLRREYTFLSPVNISQLRFRLLDPYGELVDMMRMDWSLTVELYEIVNSRTAVHLHRQFERI